MERVKKWFIYLWFKYRISEKEYLSDICSHEIHDKENKYNEVEKRRRDGKGHT